MDRFNLSLTYSYIVCKGSWSKLSTNKQMENVIYIQQEGRKKTQLIYPLREKRKKICDPTLHERFVTTTQ